MDRRIIKESPINAFLEMSILKHEGVRVFEAIFTHRTECRAFYYMLHSRNDIDYIYKTNNSVEFGLIDKQKEKP